MRFLVLFVNGKSRFNNCVVLLILNCMLILELGFLREHQEGWVMSMNTLKYTILHTDRLSGDIFNTV